MNYYFIQALTGHGAFGSYLKKIGNAPSDACWSCGMTDSPPFHALFSGTEWVQIRELAERSVGQKIGEANVARLFTEEAKRERVLKMLTDIMRRKWQSEFTSGSA
ncbi:hypothetical protein GWI33_005151 [Rhynchophorus ferrugineus]|uniref:Uncharacterized protein n=1 Tax=Rhynchophorus ferrugineus TaxID=354439 RepID=A0A834INL6_RHYFE|nr:hypothetical protein GWI33_005151 [Rhynchophorus ferrugineus]